VVIFAPLGYRSGAHIALTTRKETKDDHRGQVARRKLSLLELASDLNNVSKAWQVMGYSRQQLYEIRRNYQTFGAEGLLDRTPGAKGPHPNRVSEELEQADRTKLLGIEAATSPVVRTPFARHIPPVP